MPALMKVSYSLFIIFILFSFQVMAQDTLRSQDLPKNGDIFVLSIGNSFNNIQPSATGENFLWNYSNLESSSQQIDSMVPSSATNPALSFFFIDNILNTNRANHASRGHNFNLGISEFTDVFNYYYNSALEYEQPGLGAIIDSILVPIFYTPHDIIYKLPLRYNDEDSVSFEFEIDLSSSTIGIYYHVNRKRHNKVDGWGTLITPFGTFDVLRIKSTLTEQDSIYVSALNQGIKLPAVTSHEFKWMGTGFGLPILQINTTVIDTQVTQILYQDSIRLTNVSDFTKVISEPLIFPNPASEKIIIRYSLQKKSEVEINLFSVEGGQIFNLTETKTNIGLNFQTIDLSKYNLMEGNYFLKLSAENSALTLPLQIRK